MSKMNDTLVDVENQIIGRAGEGIRSFFEAQVEAGEQHLRGASPPSVGTSAPAFSLEGTDGVVSLSELTASGPAILLFLRGHW